MEYREYMEYLVYIQYIIVRLANYVIAPESAVEPYIVEPSLV